MLIKFCKSKKVERVIAVMLIMTMTLANLILLGKNLISYAFDENLELQGQNTQHENVKFDAYLNDNGGRNVHSVVFDATEEIQKMKLYISVEKSGYLKEAYIDFRDEQNKADTNYEILGETVDTTLVQTVNTDLKTLSLNYINSGTSTVIEVPIKFAMSDTTNINKLSQGSLITLRGIYVDRDGKETQIYKIVKLNIGWNLETELEMEQAITKYVPYSYSDQTGLIIQTALVIKQKTENKALPVKSTQIQIKVPEIAETLPEKVSVSANSTMATNGEKIEFTSENWIYDEEEKTITITVPGYIEDGNVWSGKGTDEYFITYMYPSELYEEVLSNETILHCDAEAKMELYSLDGIIEKTTSSIGDIELNEKVGDIVTYNIEKELEEISKGKIYANYNSDEKTYNTEYKSTIKVNVSDNEIVDEIYMKLPTDNFADDENLYTTKIDGISYTNYKQLIINKEKMKKLFGEEGKITIQNNYSDIYEINNQTEDIDGNYIINLQEQTSELILTTTKPVEDGILEINVTKEISKDLAYTKDQMKQVNKLQINLIGSTKYAGSETEDVTVNDTINLLETTTNAKLQISNTALSSMIENKNVEIKIELNNNVETSDLYKNAEFIINLPKYIENIEITGGNILYTNGLEVDHAEIINTENGLAIKIVTTGAESSFSTGTLTNGTNIVLNANIKVNTLTPNISDKVTMIYTNENVTAYTTQENGYGTDEVEINFVAPEEMVTFNKILTNRVEAISTEGNEQIAKLEILDASKMATMKMSILNKYSNICNNIRILGRTPFIGNKSIKTGSELGTTFDAKLMSAINTNGINAEIYYSENENATEDLTDMQNAWTTDISSITDIKSYLIVLPDYEMQTGEMLEFSYDCQIPQGLEHNQSAYGTYVVYFDSISEYTSTKIVEATKVGVTTGIGSNIETSTKMIYQGEEITNTAAVRESQYITYQTTVTNTGSVDATGVELTSTIQNGAIQEAEGATVSNNQLLWQLGDILAGEEKTVEYIVKVGKIENGNVVSSDISVTAENFEGTLNENIENQIEKSELEIEITSSYNQNYVFKKDMEVNYSISAQNISDEEIRNVKIEIKIPEGLKFYSSSGAVYNEETKMLTYSVEKMEPGESASFAWVAKTEINDNVGRLEPVVIATVSGENTISYISNSYKQIVVGPVISVTQESNIENNSYIKEDREVTFTIKLTNTGEDTGKLIKIKEYLPKEFSIINSNCTVGDKSYKVLREDDYYYTTVEIEPQKEAILTITAKAKLEKDEDDKEVQIYSTISSDDLEEKTSNTLTYIIEKTPTQNPDNPSDDPVNPDDPVEERYKITGVAWLDENEDGKKDSNEKLLEEIEVTLIDANTGVIVTDKTNGTLKQTKTSSKGVYTFTNLPKGDYIVVFEYNSAAYDITEYRKAGVAEDLSSKAIQSKINKDGKIKIAGITNTITLTDASKSNVNIGLISKPKFDLSLQKSISKIIVQNASGTEQYDFANTKLAKVEIPGKYVKGSRVYIEYRIKIKNEGEVPGYAKKIVDYMSKDFEFDPISNLTWYQGTDGKLYNDSLADIIINPGEEQELILVLAKTLTDDNTGLTTNKAEIYETYNEQNLQDYDSTPGNNAQDEDDLDYADAIISVKTGQAVIYITITLISTAILAVGIYLINKKVLKGGRV